MVQVQAISSRAAGALLLGATVAALVGCSVGDQLVSGVGNGGNHIYASRVLDDLAEDLASSSAVPLVTDDDLRGAFEAIRQNASAGNPEAALIVFRVAQHQRERADD